MSRLHDLLIEHCPDGVPHVPLSEVCDDFIVPMRDRPQVFDGDIPWCRIEDIRGTDLSVSASRLAVSEEVVRAMNLKVMPAGTVIAACSGASIGRYAIVSRPLVTNQTFIGLVCGPKILNRFLLHLLHTMTDRLTASSNAATLAYVSRKKFESLVVPLPPLEVQRELVEVLDKLESLHAGLKLSLQAEHDRRAQQYAFYRDEMLSLPEEAGVRWVPMGDLGSIFGGLTGKSKADFSDGNARFVSYVNVFNNLAVDTRREDFVRVGPGERQRSLQRGDVVFTGSSESAADVAMSSVVTTEPDGPLYLNSFCIGFRPHQPGELDPEFSKHLFRSGPMRSELVRTASGVTRFNVSKARLAKVQVPIPSLADQLRIASLLNKFDSLVTDLSINLPAEIEARRRQYEYYRDKLLTFEEAA
ncbi:restriction endonuclease subunit S [Nocardioides nematodiphilus]|uniref:restriction endonuclease subunit S n=1 Tax=Nocardioides nematodiphilus TaxID=2849669 RepID=UPI001CD9CB69|nr:restriction endonuclease subunit S [Nocardioides nematodiphilus]MCA1982960.1 restriction endonuclease subunit S [Nocardioides nematodiphilus]